MTKCAGHVASKRLEERKVEGPLHFKGLVPFWALHAGLDCAEVGQLGNLDMMYRVHQNFLYRPQGSREVCAPWLCQHPERPWLARSPRVYSPAPPTPAGLGFEENALELGVLPEAGSAWAVAAVGAEVKRCRVGGRVRKAGGGESGVWRRQSCQGSLTPAA